MVDGQVRGLTPLRLVLTGPAAVELRRSGYRAHTVQVTAGGVVEVRLTPRPRRRPAAPPTTSGETLD
ncbi:MAG: hypothetical protein R3B06_01495 [Kofleriaceae bacterium]